MSSNNAFFKSSDITVFPSSNAVDSGKLFTELNGRNITLNIVDHNYVVSPENAYSISVTSDNSAITIVAGKAIINGFEVSTTSDVQYDLPITSSLETGYIPPATTGKYSGYYLLCIETVFDDATGNLVGDVSIDNEYYNEGIRIGYVSQEDYEANPVNYLLLGGVKQDSASGSWETISNDNSYKFSADSIEVTVTPGNNNLPPEQTVSLDEYINNIVKSYWVSKGGDFEYGNLVFSPEPNQYDVAGFQYDSESDLTTNRFGVKITNDASNTGSVIVKTINDSNAANNAHLYNSGLGFYYGLYKGENAITVQNNFDSGISFNETLSNTEYSNVSNLDLYSKGNITLSKTIDNYSPTLTIGGADVPTSGTLSSNNIEAGNVIYGTNLNTSYSNINYLIDSQGRIKTVNNSNINDYISLDSTNNVLTIHALNETTNVPSIVFSNSNSTNQESYQAAIKLSTQNQTGWVNVLDINGNVHITQQNDGASGSLHADGFIVAGIQDVENNTITNPADITVPDIYNTGTNRKLQSGDIYGKQVWSAVYNDIAEIFDIDESIDIKTIHNLIIAVDKDNKFVIADKNNKSVIGVVSDNPAFCCGGSNCKNGVPIALAGRVNVKYEGKHISVGDYVGLSKKTPGYATKCSKNSKVLCGKVLQVLSKDLIEILVMH